MTSLSGGGRDKPLGSFRKGASERASSSRTKSGRAWAEANGLWETASLNRARGGERMTTAEIEAARPLAGSEAFQAAVGEMANAALTGGLATAAVSVVLAVTEEALRFQRGEIDEAGMWRVIGTRIAKAGVASAAVAGLVTTVAMAFPGVVEGPGPAGGGAGRARVRGLRPPAGEGRLGLVRAVEGQAAAEAAGSAVLAERAPRPAVVRVRSVPALCRTT